MVLHFSSLARAGALAALMGAAFAAPVSAQQAAEGVVPFKDKSRIVAIGGSLLEVIYALGEEGHVVARDTTGLYPEAALKLPDVGYMRALAPEGVLSVNPTAMLVVEGSGPPEALEVLSKGSVEYVSVPDIFTHDGILTKVRTVGKALGVDDKAEALAKQLDGELTAAQNATKDIPAAERKRVLFVISAKDGKIRAGGSDTAAGGIIELAGAINAAGGFHGYQTLTDEAVFEANPDYILMMDNGANKEEVDAALKSHPSLGTSPAIKNDHILRIEGAFLIGFGPRTPAAILELATDLYGDQVKKPE